MPPKKKLEGIQLIFELNNQSQYKIGIDINNPNEEVIQGFAWLLTQLETGDLYASVIEKFKDMVKEQPDFNTFFEEIFEAKQNYDKAQDRPLLRPSDVFNIR